MVCALLVLNACSISCPCASTILVCVICRHIYFCMEQKKVSFILLLVSKTKTHIHTQTRHFIASFDSLCVLSGTLSFYFWTNFAYCSRRRLFTCNMRTAVEYVCSFSLTDSVRALGASELCFPVWVYIYMCFGLFDCFRFSAIDRAILYIVIWVLLCVVWLIWNERNVNEQ